MILIVKSKPGPSGASAKHYIPSNRIADIFEIVHPENGDIEGTSIVIDGGGSITTASTPTEILSVLGWAETVDLTG